jgi:hypothetical protein
MTVDWYLALSHNDTEYLVWNGPSLLSPITDIEDVFSYASATLSAQLDWLEIRSSVIDRYTGESVAVLPFFLPRNECVLGNLGRCRQQIREAMLPYMRSAISADYRFQIVLWPLITQPSNFARMPLTLFERTIITPTEVMDPTGNI